MNDWAGVAAGTAGFAVNRGFQTGVFGEKFSLENQKALSGSGWGSMAGNVGSIGSFAGSMVQGATEYAMTGSTTLNLVNFDMFGRTVNGRQLSGGMLELHVGKNGVSSNLGTGGIRADYKTLASVAEGFYVLDSEKKIQQQQASFAANVNQYAGNDYTADEMGRLNRMMRAYGGLSAKRQAAAMLSGEAALKIGQSEDGKAQTVMENNMRTVYLNSSLDMNDTNSILEAVIALSHESKRNGVVGSEGSQRRETRRAVGSHIGSIDKLIQDYGTDFLMKNPALLEDYVNYKEHGKDYVDGTYDSSSDYWKLTYDENGNLAWEDDESLDFDLSLFGMGTVSADEMNDLKIMELLNVNAVGKEFASYDADPENFNFSKALGADVVHNFLNGTRALADASKIAQRMIDGGLSQGNIDLLNQALSKVQENGVISYTNPDIETEGLVNINPSGDPLYVPVQLGPGQSVHETSSYPGSRVLPFDMGRGIIPHSGIDLRGIWDSNVVSAANDSSMSLEYNSVFGLIANNSFDQNGLTNTNLLSHLEAEPTIMAYLSNFASNEVSFDGESLSGLDAGTILGNVGSTGYSEGAHLDWRTKEDGFAISPLDSLYRSYLQNDITATTEAKYLSNLPGGFNNPATTSNFEQYWKETHDVNFMWDLSTRYGLMW